MLQLGHHSSMYRGVVAPRSVSVRHHLFASSKRGPSVSVQKFYIDISITTLSDPSRTLRWAWRLTSDSVRRFDVFWKLHVVGLICFVRCVLNRLSYQKVTSLYSLSLFFCFVGRNFLMLLSFFRNLSGKCVWSCNQYSRSTGPTISLQATSLLRVTYCKMLH